MSPSIGLLSSTVWHSFQWEVQTVLEQNGCLCDSQESNSLKSQWQSQLKFLENSELGLLSKLGHLLPQRARRSPGARMCLKQEYYGMKGKSERVFPCDTGWDVTQRLPLKSPHRQLELISLAHILLELCLEAHNLCPGKDYRGHPLQNNLIQNQENDFLDELLSFFYKMEIQRFKCHFYFGCQETQLNPVLTSNHEFISDVW